MAVLDGGIDDPDGTGARGEPDDNEEGWDLDAGEGPADEGGKQLLKDV
jgi:hypothetical protein